METSPANIDLLEALASLRIANHSLAQEIQQPFAGIPTDNPRLKATIESFPERAAKPPKVPEDYKQQWQDFIDKRRDSLEPRAIRYLCWEPDIATDLRFQKYLERFESDLSARSLQGLVRSCHARWSSDLAGGAVAADVRSRLYRFSGANRVIAKWKEGLSLVLGSKATGELAKWILDGRKPIKDTCEFWKLEEQSRYLLQAVEEAAAACRNKIGEHSLYNQYMVGELIAWSGWPIERFKKLVNDVIERTSPNTEFAQALKRMVLGDSRLGDPRLPRNSTNWLGVRTEARNRFIEWLSKDDIVFFFELGLPKGKDPQGRKKFWLDYVGNVKKSRPLLCDDDRARLQNAKEKVGNFGRIVGETSAFLLDFGTVIAVEFSKTGNACYLYEKPAAEKVIPDFWSPKPFSAPSLKSKRLKAEWVKHDSQMRWHGDLEMILARYGVRQRRAD
ncbi:MAG TPA: EH signature domain-containing protein [Candidatus Binataceae bacterium]|nr:EH signature domain-containing protein [Candidatus Binataceae bacterium]